MSDIEEFLFLVLIIATFCIAVGISRYLHLGPDNAAMLFIGLILFVVAVQEGTRL